MQDLVSPLIISSSQLNAQTIHDYKIGPQLARRSHAIAKERAVSGARLLQDVQATSYHYNDFTFFSGNAAPFEFASRTDERPSSYDRA